MPGSARVDALRRAPLADRHPQGFSPSRRFAPRDQLRVLHLYRTGFTSFRFGRLPLLPAGDRVSLRALQPLDWVARCVFCLRGVAWTPASGLPRCLPKKAMVGLRTRRRNADSDVPDACVTPRRSFPDPRPLPVNHRFRRTDGPPGAPTSMTFATRPLSDIPTASELTFGVRGDRARVRLRGHLRGSVRAPDATLPQPFGRSLLPWVSVPAAKRA